MSFIAPEGFHSQPTLIKMEEGDNHGITQSMKETHQRHIQYVLGWMLFALYLFTPQCAVVCTLSKQEVLQQPEEPNQTGTERQNHSLGVPQVRQRRL